MKRIGELRQALAWIHTYRNMALDALNERNKEYILTNLKEIESQIAIIRKILEAQP